jgi:hypothetical protein
MTMASPFAVNHARRDSATTQTTGSRLRACTPSSTRTIPQQPAVAGLRDAAGNVQTSY